MLESDHDFSLAYIETFAISLPILFRNHSSVYTGDMSKAVMYIIITVTTVIGGWAPTLWGASMLDAWSILGSVLADL